MLGHGGGPWRDVENGLVQTRAAANEVPTATHAGAFPERGWRGTLPLT